MASCFIQNLYEKAEKGIYPHYHFPKQSTIFHKRSSLAQTQFKRFHSLYLFALCKQISYISGIKRRR